MPTFVLMTKLSPELTKQMKSRDEIGHHWLDQVKAACPDVKFIAHYALLGQYDFMDIYEAPDIETAGKVSMISQASGATQAESWPAMPYMDFVKMTKDL